MAIPLLSNCMLVPAVKEATKQLLQQQSARLDRLAQLVQQLLTPDASSSTSSGRISAAHGTLLLLERVVGLISNMSTHPGLRQLLAGHEPLLQQLVILSLPDQCTCTGTSAATAAVSSSARCNSSVHAAVLGCLCNLALEASVQQQVAVTQRLSRLLALAIAPAMSSSCSEKSRSSSPSMIGADKTSCRPMLPARKKEQQRQEQATGAALVGPQDLQDQLTVSLRAATVLSKGAKQADGLRQLQQLGALPQLLNALSHVVQSTQQQQKQQQGADQQQGGGAALLEGWVEAAIRTVALLTAQPGACSSCSDSQGGAAITTCLALLRTTEKQAVTSGVGGKPDFGRGLPLACTAAGKAALGLAAGSAAVQGNAALVLGHFAAEARWHAALREADAVGMLVGVAAAHGRGSAVSRNVGIALARMASDGCMMERLRELHGVEIIYQNVKP